MKSSWKTGNSKLIRIFYSLDNNVYLALYDTGGNFLYGKVPPGLEQAPQFEDGKIQTVKSGNRAKWYVYECAV